MLPRQPLPFLLTTIQLPARHQRLQTICLQIKPLASHPVYSRPRWQAQPGQSIWRFSMRRRLLRHSAQQLHHPGVSHRYLFCNFFHGVAGKKGDNDLQPHPWHHWSLHHLHTLTNCSCRRGLSLWGRLGYLLQLDLHIRYRIFRIVTQRKIL